MRLKQGILPPPPAQPPTLEVREDSDGPKVIRGSPHLVGTGEGVFRAVLGVHGEVEIWLGLLDGSLLK